MLLIFIGIRFDRSQLTGWKCLEETYPLYQPAFLVVQMVKYLPAMLETWVQSLGREDSLEKEMATHSNYLIFKDPQS